MTDRHIAYLVILDRPMREDDSQHLVDLIGRMKGVSSVAPVAQDVTTEVAYQRALADLRTKVAAVLWPEAH